MVPPLRSISHPALAALQCCAGLSRRKGMMMVPDHSIDARKISGAESRSYGAVFPCSGCYDRIIFGGWAKLPSGTGKNRREEIPVKAPMPFGTGNSLKLWGIKCFGKSFRSLFSQENQRRRWDEIHLCRLGLLWLLSPGAFPGSAGRSRTFPADFTYISHNLGFAFYTVCLQFF